MNQAIRLRQFDREPADRAGSVIDDIYAGRLDAAVLQGLFPASETQLMQEALEKISPENEWQDPNAGFPGLGIRVLGMAATVCGTLPKGPEPAAYFADASERQAQLAALFGDALNPMPKIADALSRLAGGREARLATTVDGETFAPCTVRALSDGEGILLHHDTHYAIPVYAGLLPRIDADTCISFFCVLQNPEAGGTLNLYALREGEEGDLPRLPTGQLDPVEVDRRVERLAVDLSEGDLIVFNAGKVYHRVEPVQGSRHRVTIGGFMALDRDHDHLEYWN